VEAALKLVATEYAPKKLDIACGSRVTPGYTGIDIAADADIAWDLWQFPWPIKTGSVREVQINHWLEHIPHYRPEWGARDGWFLFWEEVHRITRKGALIHVVSPHSRNDRAFWDPTHVRFLQPVNFYYINQEWLATNLLSHYTACDFEVVVMSYQGEADDIASRADEAKTYAHAHYWNSLGDLVVELKRR
jgi:hypothetical protein